MSLTWLSWQQSESGDDVVRNKKLRKQLNGETDSGVETIGNHDKKVCN